MIRAARQSLLSRMRQVIFARRILIRTWSIEEIGVLVDHRHEALNIGRARPIERLLTFNPPHGPLRPRPA